MIALATLTPTQPLLVPLHSSYMSTQMIKLFKKLRRKPRIEEVYDFGAVVGKYVQDSSSFNVLFPSDRLFVDLHI